MKFGPVTLHEVLLFVAFSLVLGILSYIFYRDAIHRDVMATSRCHRQKAIGKRRGRFVVTAHSPGNDPLYSVAYDLRNKKYELKCACKEGPVVNKFREVKVFDMRTPTNPVRKLDKLCGCEGTVLDDESAEGVYFNGHPGLVRFMNTSGKFEDTSFFDAAFTAPGGA